MASFWSPSNCTYDDIVVDPNDTSSWILPKCRQEDFEIDLHEPNLWCLFLIIFPVTCIFGNSLVVLAVLTERSLQTSTNFLLVSLAMADMLVAILVMPFAIYLTVNRLRWFLPSSICNFFCVADVSASTASIVHLVAISIDRFYAVVKHMEYKTSRHQSRIYGTILFCWLFSVTIGLPLGIGLNHGDTLVTQHCGIINPNYMFYSSIFAFYIPCFVMIVMYSFVFYKLNKRLRAVRLQEMAAAQMVSFGDNLGKILESALGDPTVVRRSTMTWAMPFIKTIEQTIANMSENEDVSIEEIDELTNILHTLESDQKLLSSTPSPPKINTHHKRGLSLPDNVEEQQDLLGNRIKKRFASLSVVGKRGSIYMAKQKMKTLKNRALELLMRLKSKQGMAIRKETRATKLVATVMFVFLLCYMPFFTTNIVKVFKLWYGSWDDDFELAFIIFTWFGYLNSCLNPAIYSLFNRKFRMAFRKILHCPGDKHEKSRKNHHRLYTKPYTGRKNDTQCNPMSTDIEYRLNLVKSARDQLNKEKPSSRRNYSSVERTSFLISVPENESEPELLSSNHSSFIDKSNDFKDNNRLYPLFCTRAMNNNAKIHQDVICNDQVCDIIDAEDE